MNDAEAPTYMDLFEGYGPRYGPEVYRDMAQRCTSGGATND